MVDYEIFDLGDFRLQMGATLRDAKLAYKTYGTLEQDRSNAVFYPTWYSGQHYDNEWLIGEGMALDPARYFIIVPNMLGNGLSSSPSNTPPPYDRARFPRVTVYDNVTAQHRLVTERFGLDSTDGTIQHLQTICLSKHWLTPLAEIVQRVTGLPFTEVVDREIAQPLGCQDFWYRVPHDERGRIARLFPRINPVGLDWGVSASVLSRVAPTRGLVEAAMPAGFDELVRDPAVHDSVMPGWNGVFTARSLARMYGAIAGGGTIDGVKFLDPSTIAAMDEVRLRSRDYVLGVPMAWRLGYHQPIFASRERPRGAFGHYGVGGSGAFADLDSGMSLAFVTNRLGVGAMPLGDLRLARLGALARDLARLA